MSGIPGNSNSVAAFSIIEAIVGMVVTAIVMSLIFVVFTIFSERMADYKNQNQLLNDMNRLTYSINKDIFENEKMEAFEKEIVFNGYSGEKVQYRLEENYILRHAMTFTDTFQVRLRQISMDSVSGQSGKLVYRKLKLRVEVNEKEQDLRFYKRVCANELIQNIHLQ